MYTLDAHVYVIHPFNVKITTTENVYMHMTSRAGNVFSFGGAQKKGHYDIQKGHLMGTCKLPNISNASMRHCRQVFFML